MIKRLRRFMYLNLESQTWRSLGIGLLVAWVITVFGVLLARWEFAAIGILVAVTTAAVAAVSQLRMSGRTAVELRMRLGELWSLIGLQSGQDLPALGGFAIGIEGAYALTALFQEQQPSQVVELGPGASSVLLHLAANAVPCEVKVTALEHDDHFAEVVRDRAARMSFSDFRVIRAPLEGRELAGWQGFWYAAGAVEQLPRVIDLLVVDGPPNNRGQNSRYPALPLLSDRLRSGAFIYVDDTDRELEHRMIERWVDELPCKLVRQGQTFTLLQWGHVGTQVDVAEVHTYWA